MDQSKRVFSFSTGGGGSTVIAYNICNYNEFTLDRYMLYLCLGICKLSRRVTKSETVNILSNFDDNAKNTWSFIATTFNVKTYWELYEPIKKDNPMELERLQSVLEKR